MVAHCPRGLDGCHETGRAQALEESRFPGNFWLTRRRCVRANGASRAARTRQSQRRRSVRWRGQGTRLDAAVPQEPTMSPADSVARFGNAPSTTHRSPTCTQKVRSDLLPRLEAFLSHVAVQAGRLRSRCRRHDGRLERHQEGAFELIAAAFAREVRLQQRAIARVGLDRPRVRRETANGDVVRAGIIGGIEANTPLDGLRIEASRPPVVPQEVLRRTAESGTFRSQRQPAVKGEPPSASSTPQSVACLYW